MPQDFGGPNFRPRNNYIKSQHMHLNLNPHVYSLVCTRDLIFDQVLDFEIPRNVASRRNLPKNVVMHGPHSVQILLRSRTYLGDEGGTHKEVSVLHKSSSLLQYAVVVLFCPTCDTLIKCTVDVFAPFALARCRSRLSRKDECLAYYLPCPAL